MKKTLKYKRMTFDAIITQINTPNETNEIFHMRFKNGQEYFLSDIRNSNEIVETIKTYHAFVRGFNTYLPESKRKKLFGQEIKFQINEIIWVKKLKIISPKSIVKLTKLWPYARKKHGHEIGNVWTVGYYCRDCGLEAIWLVNSTGKYGWTINHDFLMRHFEIIYDSNNQDFYGKYVPKILLQKITARVAELKILDWNALLILPEQTVETFEIETVKYKYWTMIERISKAKLSVSVGVSYDCNISNSPVAADGFSINKTGKIGVLNWLKVLGLKTF